MSNSNLKLIEIRLVDEEGNYSKSTVEYPGYIDTKTKHGIDLVKDVLAHMIEEHKQKNGKMDSIAEQNRKILELKKRAREENVKTDIQKLQQTLGKQ
jgi:hypothetical protein